MSTPWRSLREFDSPALLRRLALASVIANVGIVISGGAVRLTGSGLGCPTWPQCTEASYVPTHAMGGHGVVEFTNRTLTFVLAIIAIAAFVAALRQRPRRRRVVRLSVLAGLGIPAQAVIGGLTVLTQLNPWVVGLHFLASTAVLAATYAFWRSTTESDERPVVTVNRPLWMLVRLLVVACLAVLVAGAITTGSGPHAGDEKAKRTGLDPESIAQAHTDLVMLFLGLVVATWLALRAAGALHAANRAALLLGVSLAQGLIGFVQYFTHLPIVLVSLHMAGSSAVWLATLALVWAIRVRPGPGATPSRDRTKAPVGATA
ncbi:MAG TPA: COX15/CtaA family protein [Micromonosporaceae bacterium]